MWNLVRNEKKDVLLVNAKFSTKDVMVVHVFKNFECMFAEEIIWTVMNSRFQSLNEGIEIEKDSLVKSIINALNASDGSTLFKDNHDLSKNELKLEISFEIFQINLNWSNNCKQVQEMSEVFTQPLLSFTSLLMLHNRKLLETLKEKEKIIEQYKDIKIPTLKKVKKSNQKKVVSMDSLLSSQEFQDSLSNECADIFSNENRKLMNEITIKHNLPAFFNKRLEATCDEKNITEQNDKPEDSTTTDKTPNNSLPNTDEHVVAGRSNDAGKDKIATVTTVKRKSETLSTEVTETAPNSQELEMQKRESLKKKLAVEKKKKLKKLKF